MNESQVRVNWRARRVQQIPGVSGPSRTCIDPRNGIFEARSVNGGGERQREGAGPAGKSTGLAGGHLFRGRLFLGQATRRGDDVLQIGCARCDVLPRAAGGAVFAD